MYCGKCGTNIKVGNSFCTSCGERADENRPVDMKTFNNALGSLEDLLNKIYSIGDTMTEKLSAAFEQNLDIRGTLKLEMQSYIFYLGYVEGKVYDLQAKMANRCFDYAMTPSRYTEHIKKANPTLGFSHDYPTKKPITYDIFVIFHKVYKSSDLKLKDSWGLVINTYKELGTLFLLCSLSESESVAKRTQNAHEDYLSMLRGLTQSEQCDEEKVR